jgi:hypothetical protein
MHSFASYGYAAAAGHIDSVATFIHLHTLQPLRLPAVLTVMLMRSKLPALQVLHPICHHSRLLFPLVPALPPPIP